MIVEDDLNCLTDGFGGENVDGDDSMFAFNAIKGYTVCNHKNYRYPSSRRGCAPPYEKKSVQGTNHSVYHIFEPIWR